MLSTIINNCFSLKKKFQIKKKKNNCLILFHGFCRITLTISLVDSLPSTIVQNLFSKLKSKSVCAVNVNDADDTVMYCGATDSQVISDTLTNQLTLVNKWLLDNDLFIHKGKTECMLFGTGPRLALSTTFSVAINGKALNRVLNMNILVSFECVAYVECAH